MVKKKKKNTAKTTFWILAGIILAMVGVLIAGQLGWMQAGTVTFLQAGIFVLGTGLTLLSEMWYFGRLNIAKIKKNPLVNGTEIVFLSIAILLGTGMIFVRGQLPPSLLSFAILFEVIGVFYIIYELRFKK